MKCPFCIEEGKRSTVHLGYCTSTAMGWEPYYYNENGDVVHNVNPNTITQEYYCSNGHRWIIKSGGFEENES